MEADPHQIPVNEDDDFENARKAGSKFVTYDGRQHRICELVEVFYCLKRENKYAVLVQIMIDHDLGWSWLASEIAEMYLVLNNLPTGSHPVEAVDLTPYNCWRGRSLTYHDTDGNLLTWPEDDWDIIRLYLDEIYLRGGFALEEVEAGSKYVSYDGRDRKSCDLVEIVATPVEEDRYAVLVQIMIDHHCGWSYLVSEIAAMYLVLNELPVGSHPVKQDDLNPYNCWPGRSITYHDIEDNLLTWPEDNWEVVRVSLDEIRLRGAVVHQNRRKCKLVDLANNMFEELHEIQLEHLSGWSSLVSEIASTYLVINNLPSGSQVKDDLTPYTCWPGRLPVYINVKGEILIWPEAEWQAVYSSLAEIHLQRLDYNSHHGHSMVTNSALSMDID